MSQFMQANDNVNSDSSDDSNDSNRVAHDLLGSQVLADAKGTDIANPGLGEKFAKRFKKNFNVNVGLMQ